ncbi:efflux RND transporter periplasmic adaptor subunit [Marinovum sp. 2_MG-2023]|uniref:efflux RND transporter periplasmic adaptor subunit n=1 Tax=unclassified Marinovum TaxID=2647166 RepID=UPI0026E2F536|nr:MULTISPECIES: efflux RND transporter periplasmic adaptor subunit [unclassified Marinovum]MDO6731913.1 efflux RND transporter periplasmic adaptor subunit [Marinovum sp. 2_MG-2023]MDO6781165.1 efflux RND transporter periplasmic adaptor subunit [Marinovum sp. 1_MG-2023]
MRANLWKKIGAILALTGSATIANAQFGPPAGMDMGPREVGVVTLNLQEVPRIVTSPGHAVAFQQVEVRPRVGGVIQEVLYTPDQLLKVGDPLFRIDDSSYVAAEASARANVAMAEANLSVAQSTYDRAEQLAGRGYTEAEVEAARASLAEANATLDAAQAALDYAETELSWTTLTSPIAGRADISTVSVGDLVTSGQADALTTIVQANPIYVDMVETSARILSVRKGIAEGALKQNDALEATLTLENEEIFRGHGQLVTAGNSVSTTTGTVTIRFKFDNPEHLIIPGMFVRGDVVIGSMQAFLVPQLAATRENSGKLTAYIVGPDGTAQQVTLQDDGSYDNAWIVRDRLNNGDQLIVDGLSSLRPGQAVKPVAAIIDENGVARDAETPALGD